MGRGAAPGASIHDLDVRVGHTPLVVYAVGGAAPPLAETENALTRILAT
jgi:hypothetical protein